MSTTLTGTQAEAICKHMNDDHADAIAAYARVYAKIPGVLAAEMIGLDATAMELGVTTKVERQIVRVPFDHVLVDTDDARNTLIAMARDTATST